MYSQNAPIRAQRRDGNLLGAALMMSDRLVLRGETASGSTAKDRPRTACS